MRATNPTASEATLGLPGRGVRVIVSLLVIFHLLAVFTGPWSMGGSQLAGNVAGLIAPYLDTLGLANGYRFFAPEPGPSHLVRYEVMMPDGQIVRGTFPDQAVNRPRLLYHRYFMLSEFINTLQSPSAPKENVEAYALSYARHLLAAHKGQSVKLFLRRHYVPRTIEVRQGTRLDDKALYEERFLVSFPPEVP